MKNPMLEQQIEPSEIEREVPSRRKGTLLHQFLEFDFWGYTLAFANLLWSRRRFLTRFVGAGVLVSVIIALLLRPWYQSTLSLMPPDNRSDLQSKLAALSGAAGLALAADSLGVRTTGALFVNILGSRTVLDRVVARCDLKKVYGVRLDADARYYLSANTSITEDRKSGVIVVTVTDGDPRRAQAIALAYFDELNRLVAESSTSAAHRERVFIEERLRVVKRDLDEAAQALSNFSSKNSTLNVQEQGKMMLSTAAALQGQLAVAQAEEKSLEQIFTANNVRVRAARAKVAEIQRQLQQLDGQVDAPASAPPAQPSGGGYPSIRRLPQLGLTYEDLFRQVKMQEAIYETLTKQYEMAKVEEAKEIPSVRALDTPVVPERKAGPSRRLIVYLGLVLSFALGCVIVLGQESWESLDAADPRKRFVLEIAHAVGERMPWLGRARLRVAEFSSRDWRHFLGRRSEP